MGNDVWERGGGIPPPPGGGDGICAQAERTWLSRRRDKHRWASDMDVTLGASDTVGM